MVAGSGTPPRARGRQGSAARRAVTVGSTPACAGKTLEQRAGGAEEREHPRVRGEDAMAEATRLPQTGAPPRARGRHRVPHAVVLGHGSTPACAGKTLMYVPRSSRKPEHPRVRGDDLPPPLLVERRTGPPPRARGRPGQAHRLARGLSVIGTTGVEIQRDHRPLVAHDPLDRVDRHPVVHQPGRVLVPQIMEAHAAGMVPSHVRHRLGPGGQHLHERHTMLIRPVRGEAIRHRRHATETHRGTSPPSLRCSPRLSAPKPHCPTATHNARPCPSRSTSKPR